MELPAPGLGRAITSRPPAPPEPADGHTPPETSPTAVLGGEHSPKVRFTTYLRPAENRRLRNTVAALSGPPEYLTVAALVGVLALSVRLWRRSSRVSRTET